MELSPHAVSSATFKTVKKGFDPDEVRSYLVQVAGSLESSQQQATAMEARARAAIAKLQEMASSQPSAAPATTAEAASNLVVGPDEAETISRTLLLAQRTADLTVAEARKEAETLRSAAQAEADTVLEHAQVMSSKLLDEARAEARRTKDDEVQKAENEVQALLARRDFLLGDVEHLEQHVGAQRERLREASVALLDLVERVPGGLGDMRRPLLSASGSSTDANAFLASGDRGADDADTGPAGGADTSDDPDDDGQQTLAPLDPTPLSGALPFTLGPIGQDDGAEPYDDESSDDE